MPLKRGRGPEFFEEGGEVHPIRNSEGYDPDVEKIRAEDRRRERSEEAHRYERVRGEREHVERPTWAARHKVSDARLRAIAREHGTSAERPNWWEHVGLEEGSGELRQTLREGKHVGDTRLSRKPAARRGLRRGGHQPTAAERAYAARISRGSDLPF